MTDLVSAYERREVNEAEKILRGKNSVVLADMKLWLIARSFPYHF
jgi:hypothetical protein